MALFPTGDEFVELAAEVGIPKEIAQDIIYGDVIAGVDFQSPSELVLVFNERYGYYDERVLHLLEKDLLFV